MAHFTRLLPCALLSLRLIALDCDSIARLELPATAIATAQLVPAGSFTPPQGSKLNDLPAFCRVTGSIKPTDDSDIQFETWLPVEKWNGKFQGIGNGGYAGSISYGGLANAIRNGYATAATDTGHRAGGVDATWALGHPEKVVDFGHRAIHETAEKGKAITRAFYGSDPKRSYFSSCSNGGRQALMEAQRYPADYDGIIAGAPANYWTHLMANAMYAMQATSGDQAGYIPAAKVPAVQAAALAACDAADAVKDGVIEHPGHCRFDPATIQCKGADSGSCLTAAQVKSLKRIYEGLRNEKGKVVFPGYAPGGEAEAGGWIPWITGPEREKSAMFQFGTNFYKNIVYSDPAWDYKTFQVDRDLKAAVEKGAQHLNATDPDLKAFQSRGGKLLLYHGWSDAAIPAQNVINYYESVVKKMGTKSVESFVKLYMVPGMQHCGAGSGPNTFGQSGVAQGDPKHNIAAALEQWVEKGIAPNEIIATRFKTGSNPPVVERTRPLCVYPQVARYKGSGSTDDATNFTCAAPGKTGSK